MKKKKGKIEGIKERTAPLRSEQGLRVLGMQRSGKVAGTESTPAATWSLRRLLGDPR